MPKVVREYREEARKKIIAAGWDVMSREGYCATTLDDIAAQVGVTKSALYLYFRNKDDLVGEIVKMIPELVRQQAVKSFPDADTPPGLDLHAQDAARHGREPGRAHP